MLHSDIDKKLLSSRKELLDIGLRNDMLNFRPTAKSLRIVDELSEEVFKILYRQSKSMTFAGMPEKRLKQLISQGYVRDTCSCRAHHEHVHVKYQVMLS